MTFDEGVQIVKEVIKRNPKITIVKLHERTGIDYDCLSLMRYYAQIELEIGWI